MPSTDSSANVRNRKLAEALKRNMARRKAVLKAEDVVPVTTPPTIENVVDEDEDTTSPLGGCCAGCR